MQRESNNNDDRYFERFCGMSDDERYRYYIYADEFITIGGKPEFVMEILAAVSTPSKRLEKALSELKSQLKITD
mgnify:FL=1